jgi:hypothetical protein
MKIRTYSELRRLQSFEERFDYLVLRGEVGEATFGFDRWINQRFYQSRQWQQVRELVIVRDNACDLGVPGYEIYARLMVHHMNPVTVQALADGEEWILDPEYLITTTHRTHNAIHYGDDSLIPKLLVERRPGDTKLW